jgi:hypothetical protein
MRQPAYVGTAPAQHDREHERNENGDKESGDDHDALGTLSSLRAFSSRLRVFA